MPLNLTPAQLERWESELRKCEQRAYAGRNNCWGVIIDAGIAADVGYTKKALRASFVHNQDNFDQVTAIMSYITTHRRTWMQPSDVNREKGIPKNLMKWGDWVMWGKNAAHVAFVRRDKSVWQFDRAKEGTGVRKRLLKNHSGVSTVEEIWQSGPYEQCQVSIAEPPTENELIDAATALDPDWNQSAR